MKYVLAQWTTLSLIIISIVVVPGRLILRLLLFRLGLALGFGCRLGLRRGLLGRGRLLLSSAASLAAFRIFRGVTPESGNLNDDGEGSQDVRNEGGDRDKDEQQTCRLSQACPGWTLSTS